MIRRPYILLALIATTGWLFFFFRSEWFQVQDVDVQVSGGAVSAYDVLPLVLQTLDAQPARPWSGRQIFFLPTHAIEEAIRSSLYAETVQVEREANNVLRLKINFSSQFVYVTQDGQSFQKCSAAKPDGVEVDDTTTITSAKAHFLNTDFTTRALDGLVYVHHSTSTLTQGDVQALLSLWKSLDLAKQSFSHIEDSTNGSLVVQIDRDHSFLIDPSQSVKDQLERGQAILRDKRYKTVQPLVVDLRIPGRAYIE